MSEVSIFKPFLGSIFIAAHHKATQIQKQRKQQPTLAMQPAKIVPMIENNGGVSNLLNDRSGESGLISARKALILMGPAKNMNVVRELIRLKILLQAVVNMRQFLFDAAPDAEVPASCEKDLNFYDINIDSGYWYAV